MSNMSKVIKYDIVDNNKNKDSELNLPKNKLKWNSYFIAMIDSYTFDKEKLNFSTTAFESMLMLKPCYQYNAKTLEPFHILTEFLDISKNSILYKHSKKFHDNERVFNMEIVPEIFNTSTLNMFAEYDKKVAMFINNNKVKCTNKLINNTHIDKSQPEYQDHPNMYGALDSIKFKISKKASKIINYNVSKKFPKVEEYETSKMKLSELFDIFNRVVNDNKQVRFILTPTTWINNDKYGSYITIHTMEIKYKDAKICSLIDTVEKNIQIEITNITI